MLQIYRQLSQLMRAQATNTALIGVGLSNLQPGDQLMRRLFETQDELYLEIRNLMLTLPDLELDLLEKFDRLLNENRLHILLLTNQIRTQREVKG